MWMFCCFSLVKLQCPEICVFVGSDVAVFKLCYPRSSSIMGSIWFCIFVWQYWQTDQKIKRFFFCCFLYWLYASVYWLYVYSMSYLVIFAYAILEIISYDFFAQSEMKVLCNIVMKERCDVTLRDIAYTSCWISSQFCYLCCPRFPPEFFSFYSSQYPDYLRIMFCNRHHKPDLSFRPSYLIEGFMI